MITIDMRTMIFVNIISSTFLAVMLAIIWRTLSNEKGLKEWAGGALIAAVGFFMQALRGTLPDSISIVLGSACIILGLGYFYVGSRLLCGLNKGYPWHWVGTAIICISSAFYTYVENNISMRIFFISGISTCFFFASALIFLRNTVPELKKAKRLIASLSLIEAAVMLFRTVFSPFIQDSQNFLQMSHFVNTCAAFVVLTFDFCIPVSITLLISVRLQMHLKEITHKDELTNIANRRCFNESLFKEWEISKREQKPLSLIMVDVDYFKHYNDYYGHPAGDICLQKIAEELKQAIYRPRDLVARYGGEEFMVFLPQTDEKAAQFIACRIKDNIEKIKIPHATSTVSEVVTVSMGIVTVYIKNHHVNDLIKAADECLYLAKNSGRNRLEINVLD